MDDKTLHHRLAYLSEAVYKDWGDFYVGLRKYHGRVVGSPVDHSGSQAVLVRIADIAVLVFRGTEPSVSDFFSNLGYPTKWQGSGKVHSGYLRHFNRISHKVRYLAELIPPGVPLYVAGHSMGGVLAIMYASWVGNDFDDIGLFEMVHTFPQRHNLKGLVTFGAPKCMNEKAADDICCETTQYIMAMDVARYWPLWFKHVTPLTRVVSRDWWPGHSINGYVKGLEV